MSRQRFAIQLLATPALRPHVPIELKPALRSRNTAARVSVRSRKKRSTGERRQGRSASEAEAKKTAGRKRSPIVPSGLCRSLHAASCLDTRVVRATCVPYLIEAKFFCFSGLRGSKNCPLCPRSHLEVRSIQDTTLSKRGQFPEPHERIGQPSQIACRVRSFGWRWELRGSSPYITHPSRRLNIYPLFYALRTQAQTTQDRHSQAQEAPAQESSQEEALDADFCGLSLN